MDLNESKWCIGQKRRKTQETLAQTRDLLHESSQWDSRSLFFVSSGAFGSLISVEGLANSSNAKANCSCAAPDSGKTEALVFVICVYNYKHRSQTPPWTVTTRQTRPHMQAMNAGQCRKWLRTSKREREGDKTIRVEGNYIDMSNL